MFLIRKNNWLEEEKMVKKIFWLEKNLGRNFFWVRKNLWLEKNCGQPSFWSEFFLGRKTFLVGKSFGWKSLGRKKKLVRKNVTPHPQKHS